MALSARVATGLLAFIPAASFASSGFDDFLPEFFKTTKTIEMKCTSTTYNDAKKKSACQQCLTAVHKWRDALPKEAKQAAATDSTLANSSAATSSGLAAGMTNNDGTLAAYQKQNDSTTAGKNGSAARATNASDSAKQFQKCGRRFG